MNDFSIKTLVLAALVISLPAVPAAAEWAPGIATADGRLDTYIEIRNGEEEMRLAMIDVYMGDAWKTRFHIRVPPDFAIRTFSASDILNGGLDVCPGRDGVNAVTPRLTEDREAKMVLAIGMSWTTECQMQRPSPKDLEASLTGGPRGSFILVDSKNGNAASGTTAEILPKNVVVRLRDGGRYSPFKTEILLLTPTSLGKNLLMLGVTENGDSFRGISFGGGYRVSSTLMLLRPGDLGVAAEDGFGLLEFWCGYGQTIPCAAWSVQTAAGHFSIAMDGMHEGDL